MSNRCGRPAARPYHHGDLRAALLPAAETELSETGVEGFSLRAVAKRAGSATPRPPTTSATPGLLTALAAEGFARFLATQRAREATGAPGQPDRLVAAGLGYIAFATAHPALFRRMSASSRPDFDAPGLQVAGRAAYDHLLDNIAQFPGLADPPQRPRGAHRRHGRLGDRARPRRPHADRPRRLPLSLPETERPATLAAIIRRRSAPGDRRFRVHPSRKPPRVPIRCGPWGARARRARGVGRDPSGCHRTNPRRECAAAAPEAETEPAPMLPRSRNP